MDIDVLVIWLFTLIDWVTVLLFWRSPDKDSGDDPEMLVDNRILAPGITIVEEEGTLTSAELDGNSGSNESLLLKY